MPNGSNFAINRQFLMETADNFISDSTVINGFKSMSLSC